MARVCTICTHPERAAIDVALPLESAPNRRIAAQYGLSEQAVRRHRGEHLPVHLVHAAEAEDVRTAIDVVMQLREVNSAVRTVLTQAQRDSDGELVLKASDRILKQLELQAKLIGELQDGDTVNVNVTTNVAWTTIRTVMLAALAQYPEARIAVAEALGALEEGTGHHAI